MKLCSNVCNRCRLVCVKFYLNRSRFLWLLLQNVKGLTFLGHTVLLLLIVCECVCGRGVDVEKDACVCGRCRRVCAAGTCARACECVCGRGVDVEKDACVCGRGVEVEKDASLRMTDTVDKIKQLVRAQRTANTCESLTDRHSHVGLVAL